MHSKPLRPSRSRAPSITSPFASLPGNPRCLQHLTTLCQAYHNHVNWIRRKFCLDSHAVHKDLRDQKKVCCLSALYCRQCDYFLFQPHMKLRGSDVSRSPKGFGICKRCHSSRPCTSSNLDGAFWHLEPKNTKAELWSCSDRSLPSGCAVRGCGVKRDLCRCRTADRWRTGWLTDVSEQ